MTGAGSAGATTFGSYELLRYLVSGGMADLYLARAPRFAGQLVLKRIQPRYLDHVHVVRLFIDEGRIAQTLDHPNIVRTVDIGQVDGAYYIAMEYIPGYDLLAIARQGVSTGMFPPRPIAVALMAQVATGLAYAHTHSDEDGRPLSIVHCDISPGNIVVSRRGTAKIVDFGIARAAIQLRTEDGVAGKFNYMAPEQIRGERIDARADLYSLGVLLYELTVGKRLFRGKPEEVRRMVLAGSLVRPRDVRPDYPPALERIVGRLLARDPELRYPSAMAVRAELRAFLHAEESGYGKQEIARYLHELFASARRDSDAGAEFATGGDEQTMDRGMPALELERIEFDADDFDEDTAVSGGFATEGEMETTAPEVVIGAREATPGAAAPAPVDDSDDEEDDGDDEDAAAEHPGEPAPAGLAPAAEIAVQEPLGSSVDATPSHGYTLPEAAQRVVAARPRVGESQRRQVAGEIVAPAGADEAEPPRRRSEWQDGHDPDPTERIAMPSARRPPPAPEPPTALVRMPDARRRFDPRPPSYGDGTELVRAPRRRRPRTVELSTEVVVGGCALIAALALALVFFAGR